MASPVSSPRLFRGYGPLVAFGVLFVLMAALVPTVGEKVKTVEVAQDAGPGASLPTGPLGTAPDSATGADGSTTTVPGGATATTAAGQPAAGAAAPRRGTTGTTAARAGTPAAGAGRAAAGRPAAGTTATTLAAQAGGGVRPCPDRKAQVPGDPYSPPCFAFAGNNGGATFKGVSADTITITMRMAGLPDFSQAPSDSGPANTFRIDNEEIKRTMVALVDYFNAKFQFYGRKLKLEFFDGEGSFITEIQGGGQERVEADAVKTAEEYKAFADVSGFTAPYADALARRSVINIGAPYLSKEWMAGRRPFVWSAATDCTEIATSVSDYVNKRVANKPAKFAGGALKDKPRKIALIAPENPWYQQCADTGDKVLRDAGNKADARIAYKLDFSTLSNQAASVIAKLRSEGITSIVCGCDPAFPIFLTSKAQEQGYEPEWIILGAAFVDLDVFGQLFQQDQWARAFGVSFYGTLQPLRATYGYAAFKSMRPNEEPSAIVDILYYNLYLLAAGLQMAGPNLNPENYERGMYAYPGGFGLAGTWKFVPGRYTPTIDAREIYWDRNKTSIQNNEKGAYVETEPGKRYKAGEWPPGEPRTAAPQ